MDGRRKIFGWTYQWRRFWRRWQTVILLVMLAVLLGIWLALLQADKDEQRVDTVCLKHRRREVETQLPQFAPTLQARMLNASLLEILRTKVVVHLVRIAIDVLARDLEHTRVRVPQHADQLLDLLLNRRGASRAFGLNSPPRQSGLTAQIFHRIRVVRAMKLRSRPIPRLSRNDFAENRIR